MLAVPHSVGYASEDDDSDEASVEDVDERINDST